jgi:hypothetical protein
LKVFHLQIYHQNFGLNLQTVDIVIDSAIELKLFQKRKYGQVGNLSKTVLSLLLNVINVAGGDIRVLLVSCSGRREISNISIK